MVWTVGIEGNLNAMTVTVATKTTLMIAIAVEMTVSGEQEGVEKTPAFVCVKFV